LYFIPLHPVNLHHPKRILAIPLVSPRATEKEKLTTSRNSHPRRESSNSQHIGRGGGGNIFKPSKEELEKSKLNESAIADEDVKDNNNNKKGGLSGLADKAKELLGGKKSGEEKR
jgi:hypothetical protein